MTLAAASSLTFLSDGGKTGALMRAHEWGQSPLGPPVFWPHSLRSIVGVLLNSKFPMFTAWGPELGFLYNDAYAEILGDKHPAALGSRFQDIWAEIWSDIEPSVENALRGQASYHDNLPLKLNRHGYVEEAWFTFSYSPVRAESGQVVGMFCAVMETTEQVLAERHRSGELKRMQLLFEQAPGFVAVLRGPSHVFDIANDAYFRLVGCRDILGQPVRVALPELEGQGFFEQLDEVYVTGKTFLGTELHVKLQRSPDGALEERFVNFVYQPTLDHRGNVSGIFVQGNDVTDSIAVRHALQKSESELKDANRHKDEFLAILAHELRNPLAPIATAAALLKLSSLDYGQVQKTSDVITRQINHITKLVDDLLDVSRVSRGLVTLQHETLNVSGLLADAIEQVRPLMEIKRQTLTAKVPNNQLFVRGDRTRLVQVFSNIVSNAAKYTPNEGRIELRVCADDSQITVAISDDGIGITPAVLPNIFELFAQAERSSDRSSGGLGLGLALVKRLLELHGGQISAESAGLGKGSQFTVKLPRVVALDAPAEHHPDMGDVASQKNKRVLVVDDNRDAAETLQLLLKTFGYEAFIAYCANDALTIARETSPEILFLDIGLPDMDGYELARRLRNLAETAGSTIIAVTGYGQSEDKEYAAGAGFDHHLLKPARAGDVLSLLAKTQN